MVERQKSRMAAANANRAPDSVRNYIGAMAFEMARMARDEGDARLAILLDMAVEAAMRPIET